MRDHGRWTNGAGMETRPTAAATLLVLLCLAAGTARADPPAGAPPEAGYNLLASPVAASGRLSPGLAAAAMAASSLSVVLNSMRRYT